MKKTRFLSLLALLMVAVTGAWAQTTYTTTVNDGDADASKWTVSPNPAEENATVNVTYSGTKHVKSITAVKKPTDLSMVDNAGDARSSMTTANCYLVHAAGNYMLPLVYGNAIKDGAANTTAYNPGTVDNGCANFINHNGDAITGPWITKATTGEGVDKGMGLTAASAELLWQDASGLVSAVGIDGDYLTFTVGTFAAGNALIAVKDASGTILWSWHIWATSETLAASTLTTVATGSHNYTVAPVNVGWVPTGGDGKQGYAPFFQWGRKDPFIPGVEQTNASPNTNHTVYNLSGTAVTGFTYEASTTSTIGTTIQNPTYFYYNSNNIGPVTTTYYNLWDAQNAATNNVTTATKKTIYDPCPPGFCVPTGNLYYFMGNGDDNRTMTTWDDTNKGATWSNSVVSESITSGNALWFPASGCRDRISGGLNTVGSYGCYWSASPSSSYNGRYLYFNSGLWRWNLNYRSNGFSVRAVLEE